MRCPGFLRRFLLRRCEDVMARRRPDMFIGGTERPYMLRWWMPRSNWFGLYLHVFLRDDDDRALHDHPWQSLSILLSGELIETYAPVPELAADPGHQVTRTLRRGSIIWRGPRFAHRLALLRDFEGQPKQAVTLFFVGPRVRKWGFWCPKSSAAGGWRHWKDFVAKDDPGAVGPGCD
ncbi:MAG: hypothetical protein K0R27_284 [Xanthobacteraceae bacterium]|jgi:hypothetical protein|nr:hypothetical protein [Xanthobacteraceae bacterium]